VSEPAIVVDGVSKRFRLYHERNQSLKAVVMRAGRSRFEEFWALQDVSFEIEEGSTHGIVGANGCGKSTLLKCMTKILRPDKGSVRTRGKVAALLELGSGFHPELSGRENVFLNGAILGLSTKELKAKFDDIVDFAGLERFIDQPVKNYSSGMYVRLGFSVAINVDPDILLVDEVLAVGDATFQRRCHEKFAGLRRSGKTVVIVSHATDQVRTMCDTVTWLENGKIRATGRSDEIVDTYVDEGHEDRQAAAPEEGAARWGSGEAQLEKVELVDAEGKTTSHPSTGDTVTFRLHYRARQPIAKPVFGLGLETLEGTFIWGHNTRDSGFVPDELHDAGVVELTVPKLMLQPGTYDLSATIVDYTTTHFYDYRRRCLRFDVEHGQPRESGGYVALGGQWGSPDLKI
jgi:ABC-2 type transport system ATP-binding protein